MTGRERFQEAESLIRAGEESRARELFESLLDDPQVAPLACFRLGEIYNRQRDPLRSRKMHNEAFRLRPQLAQAVVAREHPSFGYVFRPPEVEEVEACPLCGQPGKPYACFNAVTNMDFIPGFHPVRLWMHCESCHHLFAHNVPRDLGGVLTSVPTTTHLEPKLQVIGTYGDILARIREMASGDRFLEVGVGAGEMTAVALELRFDVTGIDIRPTYARAVSSRLRIPIHAIDFLKFKSDKPFDVICMGDVIEHLQDPVRAIRKCADLLKPGGLLWISTPNFESAYARLARDTDPMWRVVEHMQYFSDRSLHKVLNAHGLRPCDYRLSRHYNGSMEVIAVRES